MTWIPCAEWASYDYCQQYVAYYQPCCHMGILLIAKQRGYVVAIKPLLHDLMIMAGFWIDRELYTQVLESAGEL